MSRVDDSLVVCAHCGKAHRWVPLGRGSVAHCVRCEAVLGRSHRLPAASLLALTVSAAAVFLVAISSSVLSLELRGNAESATLPEAIVATWNDGQEIIAGIVAVTALLAPALFIGLRLYMLVGLVTGRTPHGFAWCFRALRQAERWNMIEVFAIGVLLSLVRLSSVADATPGPGLFAFGALTVLFAAIESAGVEHLWWPVR